MTLRMLPVTAVAIAPDGMTRHHQRRPDAADLGPHHR